MDIESYMRSLLEYFTEMVIINTGVENLLRVSYSQKGNKLAFFLLAYQKSCQLTETFRQP